MPLLRRASDRASRRLPCSSRRRARHRPLPSPLRRGGRLPRCAPRRGRCSPRACRTPRSISCRGRVASGSAPARGGRARSRGAGERPSRRTPPAADRRSMPRNQARTCHLGAHGIAGLHPGLDELLVDLVGIGDVGEVAEELLVGAAGVGERRRFAIELGGAAEPGLHPRRPGADPRTGEDREVALGARDLGEELGRFLAESFFRLASGREPVQQIDERRAGARLLVKGERRPGEHVGSLVAIADLSPAENFLVGRQRLADAILLDGVVADPEPDLGGVTAVRVVADEAPSTGPSPARGDPSPRARSRGSRARPRGRASRASAAPARAAGPPAGRMPGCRTGPRSARPTGPARDRGGRDGTSSRRALPEGAGELLLAGPRSAGSPRSGRPPCPRCAGPRGRLRVGRRRKGTASNQVITANNSVRCIGVSVICCRFFACDERLTRNCGFAS